MRGSGFGELIRKLIYIRRPRGDEDKTHNERPRIMVTGAKAQVEICQICMGRIKEGTEYVRCGSGRVFHSVCLARLSGCPYCKRTFAIKGRESATSREMTEPIVPVPVTEGPAPMVEETALCPVCGERVSKNSSGCPACGAIFVADGGIFLCPGCGSPVKESDAICANCGEPFRMFVPRNCPVCGSSVGPSEDKCRCGAILGDRCPECGAVLAQEDIVCSNCGAAFEFI
ncbi:MAG: zinc ribbon domain-containing protein [Methanomassiliicoccus sp.]|nr:zinc ribbon domain-containing protein [Methanomassiliicoccus sp.]